MSTAWSNCSSISSYNVNFLPCVEKGKVSFSGKGSMCSFPSQDICKQLVRTCRSCPYTQLQTPLHYKNKVLSILPHNCFTPHTLSNLTLAASIGCFLWWMPLMIIGTCLPRGKKCFWCEGRQEKDPRWFSLGSTSVMGSQTPATFFSAVLRWCRNDLIGRMQK